MGGWGGRVFLLSWRSRRAGGRSQRRRRWPEQRPCGRHSGVRTSRPPHPPPPPPPPLPPRSTRNPPSAFSPGLACAPSCLSISCGRGEGTRAGLGALPQRRPAPDAPAEIFGAGGLSSHPFHTFSRSPFPAPFTCALLRSSCGSSTVSDGRAWARCRGTSGAACGGRRSGGTAGSSWA